MPAPDGVRRVLLRTFGALRLETDDGPLSGPAAQRHRLALLALVAGAPGRQVSRDRLLAMLWPEREAEQGRTLLNTAVHALRRELGAEALRSVGDSLYLDPELIETDLDRFEQSVLEGAPAKAVAEYGGPFLDGFHLPDSEPFEEWLSNKRHHYHHRIYELLEELANGASSPAAVVDWTERLVDHDRQSARAAVRHMQALRDAGDGPAALEFATDFQQRLALELGAGPDPDVRELELALLERDAGPRPVRSVISPPPITMTPDVPPPASSRWTRRAIGIGGMLGFAAIVTAMLLAPKDASGGDTPANTLLVMPFDIRGSSDLAYLGNGLMDVLAARLNGMGSLTTVDPHAVLERLSTRDPDAPLPETAWQLAESFGAGRVILGSLVQIGDRLEIRAAIHDAPGHREGEVLLGGAPTELPGLINELTRRLLAEQLRGAGRQVSSLAALTTDSLEALQALLRGEQAMREGQTLHAIEQFERAVRIDTLFALGFYRLGQAQNRLPGLRAPWWERGVNRTASSLADRLPVFERQLVQSSTLPSGAALPILRDLARRRPTSAEAWHRLGLALDYESAARGTPNAEAVAALTRARALDPGNYVTTRALAYAVARAGDWPRLASLERELAAISPEDALMARTYLAFGRNDASAIQRVLAQLGDAPEPFIVEAATAVTALTRRPPAARSLYGLLAESSRPVATRVQAHRRLADLAMAEGRWDAARVEIERAERVGGAPALGKRTRLAFLPNSPVPMAEVESLRAEIAGWLTRKDSPERVGGSVPGLAYNAGMLSARRGLRDGVQEAIGFLESLEGMEDGRRTQQLIPSLEAERAWMAGDATTVVDLLERVPDPNSNQRFLMARALEHLDRGDEAIRWYRSYPDLDLNASAQLAWRAASLIRLGDLHERRGERDMARAAREEFLTLWQDADASMAPIVEAIRRKGAGR